MQPIGKAIDSVIRSGLHPQLKQDGFKKSGRSFCRVGDDVIHVVHVQASHYNEGYEGKFTINVGAWFRELHELMDWMPKGQFPAAHECAVNERIGMLMPQHRDLWWEVKPYSDLEAIAGEVHEAWLDYGRPFLDGLSCWETGKTYILKHQMPFRRFHVLLLDGDIAEAKRLFHQEIETGEATNVIEARARRAAEKMKINL